MLRLILSFIQNKFTVKILKFKGVCHLLSTVLDYLVLYLCFRVIKSHRGKGAFILERKQKQKRRRFQSVALFPICVFILQRCASGKNKSDVASNLLHCFQSVCLYYSDVPAAKTKATSLPICCIVSNLCVYTTAMCQWQKIKEKIAFALI